MSTGNQRSLHPDLTNLNAVLSHREVAKRLGISHTQVQQIERRALRKLAKRLREWASE